MACKKITFSTQADAAISALGKTDQQKVRIAIERLHEGANPSEVPQVYRVRGPHDDLHVLRATQRLRVLFTVEENGEILVYDVVNHDLARRYFRSAG
jgi:mRNA-degrading endonuclease RelE of RelBE toxin-antitoxin system